MQPIHSLRSASDSTLRFILRALPLCKCFWISLSCSSSSSNTGLQCVVPQYLGLAVQVMMVHVSGSDHGQLSLDPLQLHLRLSQQLLHISTRRVIPHYHLQNPHNQTLHTLRPHTANFTLSSHLHTQTVHLINHGHTQKQNQNKPNVQLIHIHYTQHLKVKMHFKKLQYYERIINGLLSFTELINVSLWYLVWTSVFKSLIVYLLLSVLF